MSAEIYNFFELSNAFDLKPEQAIKHFQNKGLKASFSWLDMIGEENDTAFTVAKMMDNDLLSYVDKQVDKIIDEGLTLADFKKDLIPRLQKAGWWGKKDVVDSLTGKVTKARLGSASRLENIFRTNLQSAYAVGQWQSIEANQETAPFLMYDAVEDNRTRPEHQQWNGTLRPVDDPFWQTHYPPNGWQCRCGVIQMSRDEMKLYGLKPSPKPKIKKRTWVNPRTGKARTIAADLDPGWDHNPGLRRTEYLRQLKKEKTAQLTIAQQQANQVSDKAIAKAQKAYMTQLAANQALKKLGKAETEGAFERQKQKTLERAAQHQLDTAISENTPYLANAIKQLGKQKGTASLTAKELLEKAKTKATSIEQSVLINQYKKALVNGKLPNAKAKAAYDDLPEAAQQAIDEVIRLRIEANF
ncbi:phage minor head protein [Endozoicomonas montiporae]|uniref:Phage putative head morphogenesis protein, SPP1 gp7 n=1 Tax=Endozoicomonas montiporae CL-33 TaxID=570277 RepID=A0A142BHM8_9GAMM|nr:phage minor head protein [Endozoicomonas montiporae]AMO58254.1 phage putative head morphogenesis protein, SPP1 gp7 [Endozoicomonas montiporae CL-33]